LELYRRLKAGIRLQDPRLILADTSLYVGTPAAETGGIGLPLLCPGAETNLSQKLVTLILAAEFASKMQY